MCSGGTACPGGTGCPSGQACYSGIQCAATAPTPAGENTQQGLTFDPNNTLYCGSDYEDARANCYTNFPCPNGAQEECPFGQSCFPISGCQAPTTPAPVTPAPTPPTAPMGATSPPTTAWEGFVGVTPPAPPTPPPVNNRYCGKSSEDAADRCNPARACPDGMSTNCEIGEVCFPIDPNLALACTAVTAPQPTPPAAMPIQPTMPSDGTIIQPIQPTMPSDGTTVVEPTPPTVIVPPPPTPSFAAPSNPPTTAKPVFDPNNTLYCGSDYNDANDNCYDRTPCTTKSDCPNGENCFTVPDCQTPPPVTATTPPGESAGVPTSPPSKAPTNKPTTARPSFDFAGFDPDADGGTSGARDIYYGGSFLICGHIIVKSIVLGGAVLGVFVL